MKRLPGFETSSQSTVYRLSTDDRNLILEFNGGQLMVTNVSNKYVVFFTDKNSYMCKVGK
jgi:hypothetical protein